MKIILAFSFLSLSISSSATIFKVGSSRPYLNPNALYLANVLMDGDTIEIDPETYIGVSALAVWQQDNLLIKGVNGLARLDADGQYILGKGIWVLAGNNITIEQIEFYGASVPDMNGAGIRLDGSGMNVRHCYFHDNENGILTSNPYEGDILIEYCEFANNGFGDGLSHNLYIGHVTKLTFRFNYSHHTKIGHNLKSRAEENYISYNRIMDEESGTSSRLIDLSNGGFSILLGNLFMQGNNAPNNNMIGYGLEGLSNASPHELHFINNTLINKRDASCRFLDINDNTSVAQIANNIFTGTGEVNAGAIAVLNNNLIEPSISNLSFVDEPAYNYRLNSDSPAVDNGINLPAINGYSLIPDASYKHPTDSENRTTSNNTLDIGAYEYEWILSTTERPYNELRVHPNPVTNHLTIERDAVQIIGYQLWDTSGKRIKTNINSNILDTSLLSKGIYFLKIVLKDSHPVTKRILKI